MRVKMLGKVWRFVRKPLRKMGGWCDAPTKQNKEIIVCSSLKGERELEFTIHELLHAADWTKDEEWIGDVAKDVARVLTRLGYERVNG